MLIGQIPVRILYDLTGWFLDPIPQEERGDAIRVFFQVELAYWYYLDEHVDGKAARSWVDMKTFASQHLAHAPATRDLARRTGSALRIFENFKFSIPTFGCILVDEAPESVLLVRGYWRKSSWGFPKGKINEGEELSECAVREVLEETGFDCSQRLDEDLFLQRQVRGRREERLYIIPGVSREIWFRTRTKKEVRSIEWFRIADLPSQKRDPTQLEKLGKTANKLSAENTRH